MLALRTVITRHVAVSLRRGVRAYASNDLKKYRLPAELAPPITPAASKPVTKPIEKVNGSRRPPKLARGAWVVIGFSLIFGWYASQLSYAAVQAVFTEPDASITEIAEQKDVAGRYDEIADNFDSDVNMSEWLMGLLEKRKVIAKQCQGHVLEVSAGTGRNLGYYDFSKDSKVKSLTLLDLSQQMIDVCKKKFLVVRKDHAGTKDKSAAPVRFVAGSALGDMPLAPDGQKYDTIIQTMGLCSTAEPVELVVNMFRHLNTSNPEARILLLEHGRSTYDFWNKILDSGAKKHAEGYGCWNNRNLDDVIVAAAQKTGLEIVAKRRANFDTTYLYELRAGPTTAQRLEASNDQMQEGVSVAAEPAAKTSTWTRWITG